MPQAISEVIAVGKPLDLTKSSTIPQTIRWDDQSVTLVNLIDLGRQCERPKARPTGRPSSCHRREAYHQRGPQCRS